MYLDMLGWINLAELIAGNSVPNGYTRLLESCRRARAEGRALFPLSSSTAIELYNIGDVARRSARARVMEELSEFNYLLGRNQIQQLEVEAALGAIPGVVVAPQQSPLPLLGPSLLWSFGMKGGLEIHGPDPAAAARTLCMIIGIDVGESPGAALEAWAERLLLTGPEKHEDPALENLGYNPDGWRNILEARANQERALAGKLDVEPGWRRGNLRDVINANEMHVELREPLARAATMTNRPLDDVFSDRDTLRSFCDSMPSTRVSVSLKTIYHKNSQHNWKTNDIHDIDALSVAAPYCDAVFTDKAARDKVNTCPELTIFHTEIPRTPDDLADWLDNLPSA
ncbi:hypothetical protein BVC93_23540 [Mycobacterium sp. MS1601]|nr:hypothetical protein BVC93_23540 [Mycobacterium sp. MS1601]